MISPRTLLTTGQLVLLVLAAFLSASTVNALVAGRFRSRPMLSVSAPAVQAAPPSKHPLAYYQPITAKDVFNPPRAEPEPQAAQVSQLQAKLLGTAPGAGMDSYAIIEDDTNKTQELYRVGDKLQNRTLASVEWDRVVLKSGQGEEVLEIVKPSGKPGAAIPVASSAGGIEKRSDTDYAIDRAEVDKSLENMNQLFTQIRAVPHFQDGKAAGFRLFAIKQDSVFEKIGLKNGDIITRINGNELTDPARAMSMIQELRNEGRITVDVNRNRQPTTLSYEIR
ncbi:MAG TPA: type II secretion system protein GspC [Candidatus Binatia bacterium]|nr:type II secretion system protein GspC [Candidatus Binatia bacterium]